jgi:hypothetical protein
MLPEEAIKEYKILYAKRFGVELTDEEAVFRANNLVNLYTVVYSERAFDVGETETKDDTV